MALPPLVITALKHIRILTYFHVSSVALLIFDYFLTLPREVSLIWPSRWNVIKVLFLLTRYTPFFELAMVLHYHFQRHPTGETCYQMYNAVTWLFFIGTGLTEIMLTLRTWAVWNRDRRLSIGLPIFCILFLAPSVKFAIAFPKSLSFLPLKSPALIGCLVTRGSNILSIAWCVLLAYEAGIFLLMLTKAVQCYKISGRSHLFDVVFGNGLLYYMCLFALALINVVVSQTMPPSLKLLLASTERVFHAILGCRVVLDIRGEVSDKKHTNTTNWGPSPFKNRNLPLDPSDTTISIS